MAITLFARPLQLCGRRWARNRHAPDIIPRVRQAIQSFPAAAAAVFPLPAALGANARPDSRVLRYGPVNEIRNEKVAKRAPFCSNVLGKHVISSGNVPTGIRLRFLRPRFLLKFNVSESLAKLKLQNCILVLLFRFIWQSYSRDY